MLKLLKAISKANSVLLQDINIDQVLQNTVEILGTSAEVDRCYIFTNKVDKDGILRLYYTHEWCQEGIEVQIGNPNLSGLSYEDFPGIYEILISDLPYFGLVEEIKNTYFKEVMESQSIKSYLFTPIFYEGNLWGWIGYDDCRNEKIWKDEDANALFSVARNIGLRLQREDLENKLRIKIKHYELTVLASQQGIWELNFITNKVFFSELFMKMIGYDHYEFEHNLENWEKRIHPKDRDKVIHLLQIYLNGEASHFEVEYRLKHKNGNYIWIRDTGVAEKNEQGTPVLIVGSIMNISELIEKQVVIESQRNDYNNLINNLAETVFRLDDNKQFKFLNTNWKSISGYDQADSLNHSILEYILPDDRAFANKHLNKLIKSKSETCIFDTRFKKKDGSIKWVQVIARNTKDSNSKSYSITGSIIDINDNKETELKEKELVELKANFVSMASHQFRTPLTVIYSNLELLEGYSKKSDLKLGNKISTLSERIKGEVNRLTDLMNNILLFGRNTTKEPTLNSKKIILSSLVYSVISNYFSSEPDGRKVVFNVNNNKKVFLIDELFFTYILTNILSNAFKYSIGCKDPELNIVYDKDAAKIMIRDYGIGIPKNELNKLFNSFFRGSNTSTIQGSGLGLVVAKQFMELHNGKIEIESELGKGTLVTLIIPYSND
jgi:PAS domain S-box-containing protein